MILINLFYTKPSVLFCKYFGTADISVARATKIANALGVSLDYLVGNSDLELDTSMINRVQEIQHLNNNDKDHLLVMIDAFLRDAKTRQAYA